MEQHYGRALSNRSVRRLLQRLSYVCRRGRIEAPPLTEPCKAHIPRFLIEMDDARAQENEGRATIMCMDESLVHQLHSSTYSTFQRGKEGIVHDGFGRISSGKSPRMRVIHAITKYGPLSTCDMDFPFQRVHSSSRQMDEGGKVKDNSVSCLRQSSRGKRSTRGGLITAPRQIRCSWSISRCVSHRRLNKYPARTQR